jgi:hypothetical protein
MFNSTRSPVGRVVAGDLNVINKEKNVLGSNVLKTSIDMLSDADSKSIVQKLPSMEPARAKTRLT